MANQVLAQTVALAIKSQHATGRSKSGRSNKQNQRVSDSSKRNGAGSRCQKHETAKSKEEVASNFS